MKTCTKCGETKLLDEFNKDRTRQDGFFPHCKVCIKEWKRSYYLANRERLLERSRKDRLVYREKIAERDSAWKADRRAVLQAMKLEKGCTDCGYRADPAKLDFDHRDGTEKLFNIAHGIGRIWSVLLAEIEKCDVRCKPCHTRRHKLGVAA